MENFDALLITHSDSEIRHSLFELIHIKRFWIVIISDFEFSWNGRNTSCSSLSESFSEVQEQLIRSSIRWNFFNFFLSSDNVCTSSKEVALQLSLLRCTWLHGPSFGSLALSWLVSQLPRIVHHYCEISVIFNWCWDVVVVFFELLFSDNVVWSLIVSHRVSGFESF